MIFDHFLKSRKLYGLFLLPLVAILLAVFNFYVAVYEFQPNETVTMFPLRLIENNSVWESVIGGFIGLLLLVYVLFFLNMKYKLLSQLTVLPSFIYIFLTAGLIPVYGIGYLQVALFLLILAFGGVQAAILDYRSNGPIFNLGFFVCSAIVVYPKFILVALWAICVLFFSDRTTLKDVVALLLGFVTALFFTLFYYFWNDRLNDFIPLFRTHLLSGEFLMSLTMSEMIQWGILLLLLLFSLIRIIAYYPISIVNQRKGLASLISLLFFLGVTLLVIPGVRMDFVYVLAWPLAYLYAQYFILRHSGWVSDLFFLLLLSSCLLSWF